MELAGRSFSHRYDQPRAIANVSIKSVGCHVELVCYVTQAPAVPAFALGDRKGILADSRRIEEQLSAVKKRPFVVLHDAYRHFTTRFGLAQSGALAGYAELRPSAKRLRAIKRLIRERNVVCIFGERRVQSTLLSIVAAGTSARIGKLDALGLDIAAGPDAYFNLLARLGSEFSRCLGGRE